MKKRVRFEVMGNQSVDMVREGVRASCAINRNRDTVVRRSTLIVPSHISGFVHRAKAVGADAIMLDAEDGVAPDSKEQARAGSARNTKEER